MGKKDSLIEQLETQLANELCRNQLLKFEMEELKRERDRLHRMVQAAREGFEIMHRALYPDVTAKRAAAAAEKANRYTLQEISEWRQHLWDKHVRWEIAARDWVQVTWNPPLLAG